MFTELPPCLHYHPISELSQREGYFPNISSKQLSAVNELYSQLAKLNYTTVNGSNIDFLHLLRFLRARNFDVTNAFEMLKRDIEWRSDDTHKNLRFESEEEAIGCSLESIRSFYPVGMQGYDKQCRPISWRQFGKFEIWKVLELTSMERLLHFHAWNTEQAVLAMEQQSSKVGYNIETFVVVVDARGWSLRLATGDAYTFIKGMATADSMHFPERLGLLVVINAPSVLSVAWKFIQGFLDNVTKSKIKICSSKSDWFPILKDNMDLDQIPIMYGGTAINPDFLQV